MNTEHTVPEYTEDEIRAIARKRQDEVRKAAKKQAVKKHRDKARGKPPRKQRPNGSIPEFIRKAERNAKVAVHRARKAGKTEEEAQEAGLASYKRAIARYAQEKNIDADDLLKEAAEHTQAAGPYRTQAKEEPKPKCGAFRTQDGAAIYDEDGERVTCQHPAGWGTDHLGYGRCKFHGGNNPNGKIAAERERVQVEMVKAEIAFYGEARDIDGVQALAEEVRRTAGHVAWLGAEVQKLEHDQMFETNSQGRSANAVIKLYQDERDRLVTVSKAAISAGIAERTVRLAEEQGQLIATVIRDILWDKELNLTPEQRIASKEVVRRRLLALDATTVSEPLPELEAG